MWIKGDLFAFVIDSLAEYVSLIDKDYVYEIVNQSYCRLRGLTKDQFMGKHVWEVWGMDRFDEDIKPRMEKTFSGEIVSFKVWADFQDIGDRFLDISFYPYSKDGDCVSHCLVLTRDITDQKLNEDATRRARFEYERQMRFRNIELEKFNQSLKNEIEQRKVAEEEIKTAHIQIKQLITSIKSIIISVTKDFIVTQFNPTAEETFGIEAANVIGKELEDCNIHWDKQKIFAAIFHCLAKAESMQLTMSPYVRTDGTNGLLSIEINPIYGESGEMMGFIIWGTDITERVRLMTQLDQAQRLESIGQLSAGIAHEINTPTQYVGDNIAFLKDAFGDLIGLVNKYLECSEKYANGNEEMRGIVEEAKRIDLEYLIDEIPKAIAQSIEGVKRVSEIVKSMKEFSHPEGEDKVFQDLNAAISSTITISRNEWKYVADMETHLDPNLPLVFCFPGMFNQVILNLIVNAAHAIGDVVKNSGNKGKITISTEAGGDYAVIKISDTGTGIPESIRHKIFDPFFTTKEVGKGTGQGLAIAHTVIVEKHSGTIDFESEIGAGTTFIIRIPVGKPDELEAVNEA